jgi:signal transduction histidine kinase
VAVAEAHGGSLELIEREGAGAVFQLRLPASSPSGPLSAMTAVESR